MLQIIKFRAWLRASGLNLIVDESKLRAQSLQVKARACQAFEQLVHLCVAGILQECYRKVTVLLKGVTGVLQYSYSGVT